jgi:hypothetical protein
VDYDAAETGAMMFTGVELTRQLERVEAFGNVRFVQAPRRSSGAPAP